MNSISLIKKLSNANGISGFEDQVLAVVKNQIGEKLELEEDSMRNLYLYPKNFDPEKPVLMLDSHSDEVGFMVKSINKNGSLKFITIGGWAAQNVPAHKVRIKNREGKYINGIVASKPPHFMDQEEKNKLLPVKEMIIDVGAASKKDVIEKYKIEVGAPIVPDVDFEYDEANQIMIGKAFDNRLGTALVVELLLKFYEQDLEFNLVGSLSAQEEVGTRGAEVTARKIKPDLAIAFEGTPADDNFRDQDEAQSVLNKGGQIRHCDISIISNPRFVSFARNTASKLNIPFQDAVRTGGGNDGAKITLSNYSVPTVVIGVPVRYAHTHYCISSYQDYKNTLKWAEAIIKKLDRERLAEF
ncbi:MAG: M42 family metallopeptidase [Halanaerobium sp.]